ncbi:hypothetical protein E1B28_003230 [Marasmius oreades]|uniref:Uncharacterized protein n=1 Tax=Marasmius oreades TaxID=181124 RepID=A0A9P7UKH7_9AGAR|nr:uncharacterized protein E1B28_003230 [Marasmius oreades]KAG7085685.1 hypothetical protein E1B28_003230 [Marasmius oreades]
MVDLFDNISRNLERIGAVPVEEYLNSAKYDTLPVNYDLDLNFSSDTETSNKPLDGNIEHEAKTSVITTEPFQHDATASENPLELLKSQCKACFPNYPIWDILRFTIDEDTILITGETHKTWRAKLTITKPSGEFMSVRSLQSTDNAAVLGDAIQKAIEGGALDFIARHDSPLSDQTQQTRPVESDKCLPADETSPSEPVQTDPPSEPTQSTKLGKAARKKERKQKKRIRESREAAVIIASEADNDSTVSELAQSQGAKTSVSETSNTTARSTIEEVEALFATHKHQNSILRWYRYTRKPQDRKGTSTCGFALFVKLSNAVHHVYSSPSIYADEGVAKEACAEVALREGFSEFMRSFEGSPYSAITDDSDTVIDLQRFYECLSKPFRETFGNRAAHEIQATQWLNTTVDKAKGSQLVCSFHSIRRNGGDNLVGYLLRLERGTVTMSYLVEPRFRKEKDAKAAVCLQAMALGLGDYLRSLELEVESRVTRPMKDFANKIRKVLPNPSTEITFTVEREAYGAAVHIKSNIDSPEGGRSKYSVPCEYRSKSDAETAVLCVATRVGAIEYLMFGKKPPPPGYVPTLANEAIEVLDDQKKRAQERLEVEPGEVVRTMTPVPDETSRGDLSLAQGSSSSLLPPPLSQLYSPNMLDSITHAQELMRLRANVEKSRPAHGQQKRCLEQEEQNLSRVKRAKVK